ncbi:MAG: CoB--CoM heterodisulfide reductase iron-sulfur subunit A family protein [Bacteroidales bacterium]|nr:CoB--CoM heterodisulfide reductase iron-sulfur subunit A family protein [Bacteroidales bacterium]MBR6875301.1 CoB--CoM heterodisulfide reductase iron-sulfur subunit A family protein [Bacteroidales bacterium]
MVNRQPVIAVIGAGIAGLEAARQLAALGYKPVLIEKSGATGGHVAQWNRLFPDMTPAADVIEPLRAQTAGIKTLLGTEISAINRLKDEYNIVLSDGSSLLCQAVLFATGFRLFDASKKEEYGYGIYDRVITNRDLERWFNTREDRRIQQPKAVGFVHCVGSRDLKAGNTQCSKVCCITAIKQAIEMKEEFPDAEIYCFYMDLRLFGKKYEDFYIKAQRDHGIHFIRGRVSEVGEAIDGRVVVKAEDTLSGRPVKVTLDLLVLMAGILCNPDALRYARDTGVAVDDDGFLKSRDNLAAITESSRPGIFFAGACTGAKTVPETLAEARSAALAIHQYFSNRA